VISELTHATTEYLHSHPTKREEQDLQQIIGMLARLEVSQNKMIAKMTAWQENMDAETEAIRG
jgi:hypothetical protein